MTAARHPTTSFRDFTVVRGRILCYRLLDVGGGIALERAEGLLEDGLEHRRSQLSRTGAESLVISAPPLQVPGELI